MCNLKGQFHEQHEAASSMRRRSDPHRPLCWDIVRVKKANMQFKGTKEKENSI
jgi:hypothetical protein